jgi:hypothetical protein
MLGIDPGQKRVRVGLLWFGIRVVGRILVRRRAEGNEWSVDIEEEQRTLSGTGHDCTIARLDEEILCRSRGIRPLGSQMSAV